MKKIWKKMIGIALFIVINTVGFSQETEAAYEKLTDMNNNPIIGQVISESQPFRPTRFAQPSPNGLYTYAKEVVVKVNLAGFYNIPTSIKYYQYGNSLFSTYFYGCPSLTTVITEDSTRYGFYQTEYIYATSPYLL